MIVDNPRAAIIDTTILCNNSCYFCWRSNKPEFLKEVNKKYMQSHTMDFEVYKKIIDELIEYCPEIKWLSLCGAMGEPLMNKNIAQFLKYASDKNHFKTIVINTNGLAIDQHNIEDLLNYSTEFSASVDSINEKTYEKIHGINKIEQIKKNIAQLITIKKRNNCKAKIIVRFTENELNIGEFKWFEIFFKSLGVDDINYTKIHSFAGIHKGIGNKETVKNCNQMTAINFNFLGELTTCCVNWQMQPVFGSIKENSLKDLWNGEEMQNWRINRFNSEPCVDCSGLNPEVQKREEL